MNEPRSRAIALHQEFRNILLHKWDPIGVQSLPEAVNEYDHNVPTIYSMLIADKPLHEVVDYLVWLETDHMGLFADPRRTENVAKRLARLIH